MIAWKLFRLMKDGSIAPLFINKRLRLETGVWYEAECHPTKGFAVRTGWHVTAKPIAPHLSPVGRVWRKVEILDYVALERPESQGGTWYLANKMRVLNPPKVVI
jgi:hypothetical protein